MRTMSKKPSVVSESRKHHVIFGRESSTFRNSDLGRQLVNDQKELDGAATASQTLVRRAHVCRKSGRRSSVSVHIERKPRHAQAKGKTPLLVRANRALPQSGEEFARSSAGLPAPVRNFGGTSSASVFERPEVLVCKAIMHHETAAKAVRPATKTTIAEEDLLVGVMAAISNDDRHDLAFASIRVGFEPDATQLSEQDCARQSGGRVHVSGLRHDDHYNGVIHPS